MSRRDAATVVGSVILASSGCLERLPSGQSVSDTSEGQGQTTKEFPVDDVSVHNDRNETVEVTISVTRSSESVFRDALTLDSGETKTYEDIVANEREYEVTVRADGLTTTETFEEHRDNAGLQFSITSDGIESAEIVH